MTPTLPRPADQEALFGFWVSAAFACAAILAIFSATVGRLPLIASVAVGVSVGAGLYLAGFRRERMLHRAYRLWNRGAAWYGRKATTAIAGIWYWTVVWPVAFTGERKRLEIGPSPWRGRTTLSASAYGSPGGMASENGGQGGIRGFAAWSVRTGRHWALALLPLFWLLKLLDSRNERATASDNIYTLY